MTSPLQAYEAAKAHRELNNEIDRLRAQVELSWDKELGALQALGLATAQTIVDVGCGPGFVVERLLEARPDAAVIGLDPDRGLLKEATAYLEAMEVEGWRLVEGTATATTLAPRSAEFVLSRYTFQHLREPERAARECYRILAPGGRLVVIDVDDGLGLVLEPALPELRGVAHALEAAQKAAGGNRFVGRKLPRLLNGAGFEDVRLDALILHSDELGMPAFQHQLDADRLLPLVRRGALSHGVMVKARDALERSHDAPDPVVMSVVLVASGVRPGAS